MKTKFRFCISLGILAALGCAPGEFSSTPPEPAAESGVINGIIKDSNTGTGIANAMVILHCSCLAEDQERYTTERGVYSFGDLPLGNYEVYVIAGKANASKTAALAKGGQLRADFSVDPQ